MQRCSLRDMQARTRLPKESRIYWMHTIPFWSDAVRQDRCILMRKAQIVGCELAEVCEPDFDPEKPYEAMARRMVYHALNGSASQAHRTPASATQNRPVPTVPSGLATGDASTPWVAAQLAKKKFEEAGHSASDPGRGRL